jgi:hypothetical protein
MLGLKAREGLLASMHVPLVDTQSTSCRKAFFAVFACIRFGTAVTSHMDLKRTALRKTLAAVFAFERFLAAVDALMFA